MNRVALLIPFTLLACTYTPPATLAPAPREPTAITAPTDRTWAATIDFFADRNIPIRTLDRASGFVATETLNVEQSTAAIEWADCGSDETAPLPPLAAIYNVRVRGDSVKSTVQITVRWTSYYSDALNPRNSRAVDCVTRNKWEAEAEAVIKGRAEKG